MMRVVLLAACTAALAAAAGFEVRVSDETVPAGGLVQLKISLTDPQPISTGKMGVALEESIFDLIEGITLFSDTGDVSGAALVQGGQISARFTSPRGTFGTLPDYPLMTVVARTNPAAPVGTTTQVSLDPGRSFWADLLGNGYTAIIKPGTVMIGGSLSVSNVAPGGGIVPAGFVVKVLGTGFTPATRVAVNEVSLASVKYISPTELDVTPAQAAQMDGKRVRVENPDGSRVTYFSYLRATAIGVSSHPVLAKTTPIFPVKSLSLGFLTVTAGNSPGSFQGLALQNANLSSVDIAVDLLSAAGQTLSHNTTILPAGFRYVRELSELFGVMSAPAGSTVRVSSSAPIQMLGLSSDESGTSVIPVNPAVSPPGTQLNASPVLSALVNAASQQAGSVAPGEMVTLYGSFPGLGMTGPRLDASGKLAASLAGTRVLFEGVPAPLAYVSSAQINAIVPYEAGGNPSVRVQVEMGGVLSTGMTVALEPSAAAIFTLDGSGLGPGACLNQDATPNSAANPAARGSVISIYATGGGQTIPPSVTGSVADGGLKKPLLPVRVTIGGQPATVIYAGTAPGLVSAVLQINALVPENIQAGNAVPVTIAIGSAISQANVTLSIS
jgi:uncharacterized protein (TIGR03437 family)